MPEIEHLATPQSYEQLRLQRLRELYPELETESGRIDPERLYGLLPDGGEDAGPERYQLTWNGKAAAQQSLSLGPTGTLKPCPEESMDWETTRNVFIEGENLETLRILLKPYFRKVKMIYIDPPYNTGGDFIYKDNYAAPVADYLRKTGQADEAGNLLVANPETSGRYHSDWLTMMYPRLALARELLREDGVLFCSIDDHEVHNLRLLLNEVFGEENFVATVVWQKAFAPKNVAMYLSEDHEYLMLYARSSDSWRPALLPRSDQADARYSNPDSDTRGPWASDNLLASLASGQRGRQYQRSGVSANLYTVVSPTGFEFTPPAGNCWRYSERRFAELDEDGRIYWGNDGRNMPRLKRFLSEVKQGIVPQTLWLYRDVGHTQEASQELRELLPDVSVIAFPTPKPTRLIERCVQISGESDADFCVLDFFAGTGSTAHAAMHWNYSTDIKVRYIMVQLPEMLSRPQNGLATIADIGKERIRRVAARIREERAGQLALEQRETPLDLGMRVFKLGASSLAPEGEPMPEGADYLAAHQGTLDSLLQGWQPEELLWEVLLREGLPLDCRIETLTAGPQTVYRATDPDSDRQLYVCLDDAVSDEPLAALLGDDAGVRLVCRESALVDDTVAQNLALHCQLVTL